MGLILRNGTIVGARESTAADVRIVGEIIAEIGPDLPQRPGDREIDVAGTYLLPGAIDVHTHVEAEFQGIKSVENFHSGTVAAACGGVTTLIDYALPGPGDTVQATLAKWHGMARDKAVIDYGFHVTIFEPNDTNIQQMRDAIADGHSSFKIFMIGDFEARIDGFMAMLAEAGRQGALVNIHVEDASCLKHLARKLNDAGKVGARYFAESRPPIVESLAATRAIAMAEVAEAPIYLVHLSHEASLEAINQARGRNQVVFGETRPCYLHLSRDRLDGPDGDLYASWPALREPEQMEILWQGLASGVLQTVATDHDGWSLTQKRRGKRVDEMLAGMAGLETLVPMLHSEGVRKGRLSINRLVEVTATNPAKLFGLYPRKGVIAVGADADIVVFDPGTRRVIRHEEMHSAADWDPFEGWVVDGWPRMTLSRGEIIVADGMVLAQPGRGRLLHRKRFSESTAAV